MLISEAYREQNRLLHEGGKYGKSGQKFAPDVARAALALGCETILDYGCGQQTLAKALAAWALDVRGYDPSLPGLDGIPEPADMVACTDVLEHIEPECLSDVLADIKRCALKAVFISIHTGPAIKTLPDGRNAHLIQASCKWWVPKLWDLWEPLAMQVGNNGFWFAGKCSSS